jgi:putative acetyltransferase
METIIRPETAQDIPAIYQINKQAFDRENEAHLVNRLRENEAIILSLVAEWNGQILGHILFSPVIITDDDIQWQAVGLGPVAVLPEFQNSGIGSALIRAGLDELKKLGHDVVIVLGHSGYYPRFGFKPSRPFGIQWEMDVPEEAFMVAELNKGSLNGRKGIVHYHPAFRDA